MSVQRSAVQTRVVEARGCRLHYEIGGEGPDVLLVQGVGLHGRGWAPQTDVLRARFRCLTFDNRGMAASQPVGEPLTMAAMVADVIAILDHAGIEKAHLVGHSMGGTIALATALAHPARVRSLVPMCTFARGADATKPTWTMMTVGVRTMVGTRRMRRHAFLEMVYPESALAGRDRDALASELASVFGHDLADQPPIAMKQLDALSRYDATPRLGELGAIPTLVMAGAQDVIALPAYNRVIAEGIPGATYEEHADAGHGLPIQHAARVNARLAEHFDATSRSR